MGTGREVLHKKYLCSLMPNKPTEVTESQGNRRRDCPVKLGHVAHQAAKIIQTVCPDR